MHYSPEIAASNVAHIITPATRPSVLNTNHSGRPLDERGGNTLNSSTQQQPFVRSRAEAGSQKDSLRFAAESPCTAFKAVIPHTYSSGAPSLPHSILFALTASAVPAAFALFAVFIVSIRSQFFH